MESFITIITAIFYAFKVVIHLTVILCSNTKVLFYQTICFCLFLQCYNVGIQAAEDISYKCYIVAAGANTRPQLSLTALQISNINNITLARIQCIYLSSVIRDVNKISSWRVKQEVGGE